MTVFAPGDLPPGAKPIDVAMRFLGVQEDKGRPNRGHWIDIWNRYCYVDPDSQFAPAKGYAWCASFVAWCCNEGGRPFDRRSPRVARLFDANYQLEVPMSDLEPGDVVFHFDATSGNHVGFYLRHVGGIQIQSCDGNTNDLGSREGNAVGLPIRHATYWDRALRPRPGVPIG